MTRRPQTVVPSESDTNDTDRRASWMAANHHPATQALLDRDARVFLHQSVSTPCLSALKGAEGIWLEDTAGRRYMDFHGNNVHHIGHGHPRLKEALIAQMAALPFAPRRFTNDPAVDLAESLVARAPGDLSRVLLAPSGSDAVDMALKLARVATGRFKTVSFWDAFHGAGLGPSSVGGEALFRSGGVGPLLPGTEHVAPFACYRCPYGHPAPDGIPNLDVCKLTCANMVRYVLEKEGDVAAVIAETVRVVPYTPPPGFWKAVRQACDDMGALLILDEIPCGLGKTGSFFACAEEGVAPDMVVLGKALGGGMLPTAALIAREGLNDSARPLALGHFTHEKNPLMARAALTTLSIIDDEGLVENARNLGAHALERLRAMKARDPGIGDVRGRGLLLGIEMVSEPESRAPDSRRAEEILYRCLDQGLSFKTTMGNVITLTPPMMIDRQHLDRALDIVEDALYATFVNI
ncbi:MAG: aspartate aminotransferase family protein [Rhodospirillum sp.]|nr:aspartate aminotransferase family protein [Rhodospirillum sp.]MCF8488164.1 aspartate aminotransferase family protein [Rhodospirillum sp.]MCF8499464.1 aspartate aminotransferase family protein [Rhodospirillum sp.]